MPNELPYSARNSAHPERYILGKPHPDRARQFKPFAALRGYEELIEHGVDISEVVLAEKKYLPQKRKASLENKIAINHLIEKNVKVTVQEFPNEEATVIEKYKIKGNKGENKIW